MSASSSSSPSSSANDKIILSFGWKGPVASTQGIQRDVGIVDLLFEGAKTKISANLETYLDTFKTTGELNKISFTCYRDMGGLQRKTNPDVLSVTIEQIQNLRLKAGFFQESTAPSYSRTVDSSGNITTPKRLTRTDSDVPLTLPEKLEVGKKYRLVVTSNNLVLTAVLVKEEAVAPTTSAAEDVQLAADKQKLLLFMSANLLALMGLKMQEFTITASSYIMSNQVQLKSDFGGELPGIIALKEAIAKLDNKVIKELAAKVPSPQANTNNASSGNQAFFACIDAFGSAQGLSHLMRSQLMLLIESKSVPAPVETIITNISNRFGQMIMDKMN